METLAQPGPSIRRKYMTQRCNAKRRGLSWELSYAEWLALWVASGKWDSRGCGAGSYCMGRNGDEGAYALGNVAIVPAQANSGDGARKARAIDGGQGSLGRGRGWTYIPRLRLPYQTNILGRFMRFATAEEAQAAYRASVEARRGAQ